MQIIELKQLVANYLVCQELVTLGVIEAAALAWEPDGIIVNSMDASEQGTPAYSLEELAIGLGNFFPLPGFAEPRPKAVADTPTNQHYNQAPYLSPGSPAPL